MTHVTATQERDVFDLRCDAPLRLRVDVLDALAERRGIKSVAALARKTGISRSTLFRLRRGEVVPRGETAFRIAEVAGTTVEALFYRAVS